MNQKQSGFGIVEAILVLVILGIIGFTGWRVYEANREVSNTPVYDSTVAKPQDKKVSLADNLIRFSLPKGWEQITDEWCSKTPAFSGRNPIDSTIITPTNSPKSYFDTQRGFQVRVCVFDDTKTSKYSSEDWYASEAVAKVYGGSINGLYTASNTTKDSLDIFVNQIGSRDVPQPYSYAYVLTKGNTRVFIDASLYTNESADNSKKDDYRNYEDDFKKIVATIEESLIN